jgi:hypothetical protein
METPQDVERTKEVAGIVGRQYNENQLVRQLWDSGKEGRRRAVTAAIAAERVKISKDLTRGTAEAVINTEGFLGPLGYSTIDSKPSFSSQNSFMRGRVVTFIKDSQSMTEEELSDHTVELVTMQRWLASQAKQLEEMYGEQAERANLVGMADTVGKSKVLITDRAPPPRHESIERAVNDVGSYNETIREYNDIVAMIDNALGKNDTGSGFGYKKD